MDHPFTRWSFSNDRCAAGLSLRFYLVPCPLSVLSQSPDWRTPAEISNYRTTPDYAETVAYLERIAETAPGQVRIENFGKTGEGRDLKIVIASRDGVFDPAAVHASGRAVLLVQNAIHAGEMDGKDACLALLRDIVITKSKAALLDHVVFVFIPVYNLDGHERRSAYNRINQNGPEVIGWRGNGSNINLNRDYMKADAPETRAFLKMFHRWMPDFFVDDHVTDGADFQYDVTFNADATPDVASSTARWLRDTVTPELERQVNAAGHLAFPSLIDLQDDTDPAKGLFAMGNPPRFSTGQMILENRPGLLVEIHMVKDYKTRVTGNYEILRALLEVLNRDAAKVIALNQEADAAAAQLGAHPLGNEKFPWPSPERRYDAGCVSWLPVHARPERSLRRQCGSATSHEPWNVTLPLANGVKVSRLHHAARRLHRSARSGRTSSMCSPRTTWPCAALPPHGRAKWSAITAAEWSGRGRRSKAAIPSLPAKARVPTRVASASARSRPKR